MNSKEASWKVCKIWLKLGLHGNFWNFANMDKPSCHVWKVTISFSCLSFSHIERVTTHYQTLQTWIGLNETIYYSLNALPHEWRYFFTEICLVLGYLQHVTTCYHYFFFKNINIFFINLMVARGNALEIVPKTMLNLDKMYVNACSNILKLW